MAGRLRGSRRRWSEPRHRDRREGELIELSDDEAVAAAIHAADGRRRSPGALGLKPHRRRVQAQCPESEAA